MIMLVLLNNALPEGKVFQVSLSKMYCLAIDRREYLIRIFKPLQVGVH